MADKKILALGLLITVGLANASLADIGNGHDKKDGAGSASSTPGMEMQNRGSKRGMMDGDHHAMMRSMMQMHMAGMSSGGMEHGEQGMMDRDIMSMMMTSDKGPNLGDAMKAKVEEFDTDNDGALTLSEFEALHVAALRERMVDRFQHLDSDGDGQITQKEIETAGTRMSAMTMKSGGSGMDDHHDDDK
ncbi:EF hand domain-containing protein [Litoreibacter halocynthiae]|uniref:EF hand domain-containing protein n=1 Tax=Litoreibacter halocynthiae TaxID=1242689 RepID=A0A4R7LFJ4_9RHOB|nr:calcium-binding protein [Litoreibacter halocynthiae]TDT72690.1 EF hand domain-containing protein [Litoreibacter halocynthiae]